MQVRLLRIQKSVVGWDYMNNNYRLFADIWNKKEQCQVFPTLECPSVSELLAKIRTLREKTIEQPDYKNPAGYTYQEILYAVELFGMGSLLLFYNDQKESKTSRSLMSRSLKGASEEAISWFVLCLDEAKRPTLEDMYALKSKMDKTEAYIFGDTAMNQSMSCMGFPKSSHPMPELWTRDNPKALIIGGKKDINTPEIWSIRMAQKMNALYLDSRHEGHGTVFGAAGTFNYCADRIATHFMLKNELPSVDKIVCKDEQEENKKILDGYDLMPIADELKALLQKS